METTRAGTSSASRPMERGCVGALNEGNERDEGTDLRHVLEIAQAPTRGRTCGFGDSDRRALSAPLIARLRVFSKSENREVPADDFDISFLVVAADLWSADGTEDMNLVQHPSSHLTKAASPLNFDGCIPTLSYEDRYRFSYGGPPFPRARPSSNGMFSPAGLPMKLTACGSAGQHAISARPSTTESEYARYRAAPEGYSEDCFRDHATPGDDAKLESSFRSPPFNTFAFQAPRQSPPNHYQHLQTEAELERLPSATASFYAEQPSTAASNVSSTGLRLATTSTRRPSTGATSMAAHTSTDVPAAHKADLEVACVKNLIGAVTTNGHKLKAPGEAGLGIFFVFHDLSVRTEGTFTIRLRLVSIGRQPLGTCTGAQPVLTECFTPPFEVMSAKKFPGMLDPTPMSQAFAKQGLRIPTRKGANRKRRRQEDPEDRGKGTPTPEEDEEDPHF